MEDYQPRTRAEEEVHAALIAAKALEKKEYVGLFFCSPRLRMCGVF
jgi:hypothetical protein